MVPDNLRGRWELTIGSSSDCLEPLLNRLTRLDIFLHDSEYTYRNMMREFHLAWHRFQPGGLLLSHNIDYNNAFSDFCASVGAEGFVLDITGGLVKPPEVG